MDDMEHQAFEVHLDNMQRFIEAIYKKYAATIPRQQIGLLPMYGSS